MPATITAESVRKPPPAAAVRLIPFIAGALMLAVLPAVVPRYVQTVWTKFVVFALFASSYDLIYGHAGLLSLGHAAYFGTGGYAVAVLMHHFNISSLWIGLPFAIVMAAFISAVFGFLALRVSGMYFLLVTFAFGELLYSVTWNVKWLSTPGMQGISGLPRPSFGIPGFAWNTIKFYYFVLIIFLICFFLVYRIMNSPFGHALRGIRENEARMQTLGYNTWLYKYIAFIVTGTFAGAAGALFVYFNRFISPTHVGVGTSFLPMIMVIIGGSGTLLGPVIGAFVIIFTEYFASLFTPERWPLVLGALFVAAILYARGGINVHLARLWKKAVHRNERTSN